MQGQGQIRDVPPSLPGCLSLQRIPAGGFPWRTDFGRCARNIGLVNDWLSAGKLVNRETGTISYSQTEGDGLRDLFGLAAVFSQASRSITGFNLLPRAPNHMASEVSRGAGLLEEGQSEARSPDTDSWDSQILVLASDETRAERIASGLAGMPHQIEVTGDAGWQARRLKLAGASTIILASPRADLELLTDLLAMRRFRSIPILVFVDLTTREDMSRALKLGVSAYIVDGLVPERMPAILQVAEERHAITTELRDQLRKSQEDLVARKTIERAKGLLMTKSSLPEQEVYDSMRRMAMSQGKPLREVAENILAIFAIFP